jgi:hypothetical protein
MPATVADQKDAFTISATVEWRDMDAEKWLRVIVQAKPQDRQSLIEEARKFLGLHK